LETLDGILMAITNLADIPDKAFNRRFLLKSDFKNFYKCGQFPFTGIARCCS